MCGQHATWEHIRLDFDGGPKLRLSLKKKNYTLPHVVYECCPEGHGVFLDAGEFTDLMHKTFWDKFKRAR